VLVSSFALILPLVLGLAGPAAAAPSLPDAPGSPPVGAPPDTDQAYTDRIVAELQAQDPDAAALFAQAAAARDLGQLSRAGDLYAQVTQLQPTLDHAWRRHCTVLQEAGLRDEALPRCEQALALSPRSENQVSLAYVLLDVPSGVAATASDRARARELLVAARSQAPDDPMNARLRCHLAMEEDDLELLRACVADLERLAPHHVMTGFHAWALAYREGRWNDALDALDQAQAAGMPAMDADSFRRLTRLARPWYLRWGPALGVGATLGLLTLGLGRALRGRARQRMPTNRA